MEKGLLTLPLLPLRAESSERAEMTTQLLFGECVEVLEDSGDWVYVRNEKDGYLGWATKKMLIELTDEFHEYLLRFPSVTIEEPLLTVHFLENREETLMLPAGSRMFPSDETNSQYLFPIRTTDGYDLRVYQPKNPWNALNASVKQHDGEVLSVAKRFLHAPYLWGGKTVLGMDCSGLVQVSAAICGFDLPRDAKDQALLGEKIPFENVLLGDVAFFQNPEGRIVHVGLIAEDGHILHASGSVRMDIVTAEGITHSTQGHRTHTLSVIKRIFSR